MDFTRECLDPHHPSFNRTLASTLAQRLMADSVISPSGNPEQHVEMLFKRPLNLSEITDAVKRHCVKFKFSDLKFKDTDTASGQFTDDRRKKVVFTVAPVFIAQDMDRKRIQLTVRYT